MKSATNENELVDISTVSVDKTLSRDARIQEFVRQIRNPYHFKCGNFNITAKYAETGLTFEECLTLMMV
ncbi:MAG: hypothetical protein FWF80_03555 [Defluviitaleaceae bacterium]|nr:hypothetical protein [Defluviitaleaceae bacterium]